METQSGPVSLFSPFLVGEGSPGWLSSSTPCLPTPVPQQLFLTPAGAQGTGARCSMGMDLEGLGAHHGLCLSWWLDAPSPVVTPVMTAAPLKLLQLSSELLLQSWGHNPQSSTWLAGTLCTRVPFQGEGSSQSRRPPLFLLLSRSSAVPSSISLLTQDSHTRTSDSQSQETQANSHEGPGLA